MSGVCASPFPLCFLPLQEVRGVGVTLKFMPSSNAQSFVTLGLGHFKNETVELAGHGLLFQLTSFFSFPLLPVHLFRNDLQIYFYIFPWEHTGFLFSPFSAPTERSATIVPPPAWQRPARLAKVVI